VGRRISISLGEHATLFRAEVYAILGCVHEIDTQARPEKFVSSCSDNQTALKALQAAKPTSPLVRHCQKVLNDIFTRHTVGLYWVPGHAGLRGNETADKLARDGFVQKFVGPALALGVSRQNIRRKITRWMDNQRLVLWRGPCSAHRQARELISGPKLPTKTRLLSLNRTQSRVVFGVLTGYNKLRRYLYVMGLSNNPICRKCGTEDEASVYILCACEVLASLRHAHLGYFFLDPEDIINLSIGVIWNLGKGTKLLSSSNRSWDTKGLF
jgi:hypothetical protein